MSRSTALRWVDSHCHLQGLDPRRELVDRSCDAGVDRMVCVGTDAASSRLAVEIAEVHPEVWAVVGLHPHDARRFESEWSEIVELAGHERVVGVGESGFDLHYRNSPEADQEHAFRAHIGLAKEISKPLVVHSRDAWGPTFRVLRDEGPPSGTIFHCFTGGPNEARQALDLGAHLSFSGIVTFANAHEVRAAAAMVPLRRLLVETDSPFLTPVPHRGRPNEPAYVVHVGERLAAIVGCDVREVASATSANAAELFGL